jgi:FkbM family methyltransferase
MKTVLKKAIQATLRRFNLRIVNRQYFEYLVASHLSESDLSWIAALSSEHTQNLLRWWPDSKAQFRQDLFVLAQLGFKQHGYFVEFGAADGVLASNTCLLERSFGWTGIVAEPARYWREALLRNRTCRIDTRCVWGITGETVVFNEVDEPQLSTIARYSDGDMHGEKRAQGTTYDVETVSLNDLLRAHQAPDSIDYLSIDTEGSEFEILSRFDFERYRVAVITCEHNFTPMRHDLHRLLESKGYVRTLQSISSVDDWYVSRRLLNRRHGDASSADGQNPGP